MRKTQREAAEQIALFEWAVMQQGKYPELAMMFHVPNGGSRNELEAANLKRQGVKAGVLDVWLPVPRGGFHGLVIEMKAGKNKPTQEQLWWIANLIKQGYYVSVSYSWKDAADKILNYLNQRSKL